MSEKGRGRAGYHPGGGHEYRPDGTCGTVVGPHSQVCGARQPGQEQRRLRKGDRCVARVLDGGGIYGVVEWRRGERVCVLYDTGWKATLHESRVDRAPARPRT